MADPPKEEGDVHVVHLEEEKYYVRHREEIETRIASHSLGDEAQ